MFRIDRDFKHNLCHLITVEIIIIFFIGSSALSAQQKGGRWMFDNTGKDEALWDNVDNNGSLAGKASYSDIEPVLQGTYYLSLEDSAEYGVFTVDDQDELDFHDENFAASLWIYPIEGYDNPQHLFLKGERSGSIKTNNYALRLNNEYIEFIVHSESGSKKVAKSSFKLDKREWNFIAVYYDFTNSILYFWNDAISNPVDTIDFDAPLFPNDNKLYVGTSGENGFKRFWGRMDDLRIGNKLNDIFDATTGRQSSDHIQPEFIRLQQNYPNPFNPHTVISFTLNRKGFVNLSVYNVLGSLVDVLINDELSAGEHSIEFESRGIPTGIYFYRLQQGMHTVVRKMTLMK